MGIFAMDLKDLVKPLTRLVLMQVFKIFNSISTKL